MGASVAERLVNRLATIGRRPTSRRSFVAAAALSGAALAVDPVGFVTKPQSAYASVCGTDASCGAGYSVFCCTINGGHNTCPPNTYAGGWWKADRSSYCGGGARYYIDCNALPGHHFRCHCNTTSCDHRRVACNWFRYGQCNRQIKGVTPVVCRKILCRPPWQVHPSCTHTSRTDNNTRGHTAPCLNHNNTYPALKTFPYAVSYLQGGHSLYGGHWLTSHNRHTMAYFGTDGNLTVHNQYGVVWQSGTAGKAPGGRLHLYHQGMLAILDRAGHIVWKTPYHKAYPSTWLHMRDSGDLQLTYGPTVIWHTGTHTS